MAKIPLISHYQQPPAFKLKKINIFLHKDTFCKISTSNMHRVIKYLSNISNLEIFNKFIVCREIKNRNFVDLNNYSLQYCGIESILRDIFVDTDFKEIISDNNINGLDGFIFDKCSYLEYKDVDIKEVMIHHHLNSVNSNGNISVTIDNLNNDNIFKYLKNIIAVNSIRELDNCHKQLFIAGNSDKYLFEYMCHLINTKGTYYIADLPFRKIYEN